MARSRSWIAMGLLGTLSACAASSAGDLDTTTPPPSGSASDGGAHDASHADGGVTTSPPDPGNPGLDASTPLDAGDPGDPADDGAVPPPPPPPSKDAGAPPPPPPPPGGGPAKLPTPHGACPEFKNGAVQFQPTGGTRDVTLFMSDAAKSKHGPLIFYFYGTGGSPSQAQQAFSSSLSAIEAAGGIVAAPKHVNSGQFPWIGSDMTVDYNLVDEVVGCAIQKVGIDTTHIHSLGFSAGALFTTQLAFARSDFIASIGTYSGGLTGGSPAYENPANKWGAMIMTGGTNDNVFGTDFLKASQTFQTKLKGDGHFAMLCNHGGGHSIPSKYTGPIWQFFQDHPFGRDPSPYAGGLPAAFTGCTP